MTARTDTRPAKGPRPVTSSRPALSWLADAVITADGFGYGIFALPDR
ncbi:hypothetical protein GCM10009716_04710 [Streptomyces sodiiphilus]|uniref:Uncharacterized protein n=1 Tax=Streptomyces sodiiphilus TaxID=226217 RepID=A0ABN2NRC9_9ACTN